MNRCRRPLVLGLALAAVLTLGACSGSSGSGSDPGSDVEVASRNATIACGTTERVDLTRVTFRNDTNVTIVLKVLDGSWRCDDYTEGSNPGLLEGMIIPPGTTSDPVSIQPLDVSYSTRSGQRNPKFELGLYTPSPNGRGSQLIAFGPDSTLGFSFVMMTVPGFIEYNEWHSFVGRTGPVNTSSAGGTTAYLPDSRPVDLTWDFDRQALKIRASLRATG